VRVNRAWPGRVVRRHGRLAVEVGPGQGNIKVTYLGGYASVPPDLQLAVWQILAEQRTRRDRGQAVLGEGYDGYSIQLATPDVDVLRIGSVASIVGQYRRVKIG